MRKIVASEYVTLDGVMENPQWTVPFRNDEGARFKHAELFASDALLLGRVTYQGFAAAWPTSTDEQGFADRMNSLPKFVASTTLDTLEWNASLIKGDVPAAVSKLKQQPGGDILIYGSADLVNTLLQHDLIDEYRLMVHPLVLGHGKRLFRDGNAMKTLQFMKAETLSSGVVVLFYAPTSAEAAE